MYQAINLLEENLDKIRASIVHTLIAYDLLISQIKLIIYIDEYVDID